MGAVQCGVGHVRVDAVQALVDPFDMHFMA